MNKKQIICLVFGVLLCILPVYLVGIYVIEFAYFMANEIYSRYSPEAWLLTGMLGLGIILIILALDIKMEQNTE